MAIKKTWEGLVKGKAYYFTPQRTSFYQGKDTGKYDFTLEIDKDTAKELKAAGASVVRDKQIGKDEDDNPIEVSYSIKPKSKFPIKVIDGKRNSLDLAITGGLMIGNGSTITAHIYVYEADPKNGCGVNIVQINNLVEYKSANSGGADSDILNSFSDSGDDLASKYNNIEVSEDKLDSEIPF